MLNPTRYFLYVNLTPLRKKVKRSDQHQAKEMLLGNSQEAVTWVEMVVAIAAEMQAQLGHNDQEINNDNVRSNLEVKVLSQETSPCGSGLAYLNLCVLGVAQMVIITSMIRGASLQILKFPLLHASDA